MADDRSTIHAIAWEDVFPAVRLFGALRMALNFRTLLLAAAAVIGTTAGWRICGAIFSRPAVEDEQVVAQEADSDLLPGFGEPPQSAFERQIQSNNRWPWEELTDVSAADQLTWVDRWRLQSPLVWAWNKLSTPFARIYSAEATIVELAYWLCCALWSLIVWSFFGGAITRVAAVNIARQENVSWGQLAGFVRQRLGAYFAGPLFPLLGTFLVAISLAVLGLLMRANWGLLVAGVAWPLVLLAGFVMAFLVIGLFFAWPLMWSAISAEGTDAFGALSHSYSYTYQRPVHYLFYAVIAALIGFLGWYLVDLFVYWILELSMWGISWGSGSSRLAEIRGDASLGRVGDWGRSMIRFWTNGIYTLEMAYFFAYFWTATTVIYFLLRRLVDATEIDEVYMPEEHQLHGLPPLKTGPDGVPDVVSEIVAGDEQ